MSDDETVSESLFAPPNGKQPKETPSTDPCGVLPVVGAKTLSGLA